MATSEKIKLQGASAYKKDLQQIAAQSKALAAEMKMVKSSFDKSTTAEEKNEAIGKQLTKQIELQKQRVDMLRKAYEEEVAVSGEQSEAAAKAQAALFKGQEVLNKMEQENRELAQAEDQETQAAERNETAHGKLNGVLKAAGAAIGAVAAATAAAAKALWDCANAAGQWADNLLTLSAQTDVSADTLQRWDYAARFIDTDTETMAKALAKVVSQQGSAIKSGEDYITTLDGQQIALKNANGEYKTSEQLFYEMIDTLGQIEDPTLQDAAAQDLFGKSFQDLKPLINAGSEGLKAYGDEAERLGLIMSEEAVGALGAFDDQMQKLKATTEVAGRELAVSFLPATQKVAESLTELASTVTTALSDGFQDADVDTILGALFDKLSQGLGNVAEIMPGVAKFVTGLAVKIIDFVTQNGPLLMTTALQIILAIVNGLAENLPEMIPAIVEMIMTIVNTLMAPENIALLMDAAIALITGLGQGLINAVPVLIQQLPTLVMNIVRGLITQAVKMNQAGQALVSKLSSSISTAMGGLITQVKTWVQEKIIEPVKSTATKMAGAGRALVEGLWKGISDKFTWIKNKITEWCGNVVDWFKAKFGVHSPSTVFAGIGENLAEGLAIGWKDGMSAVRNAMSNVPGIDGSIDASPYGMGGSVINIYPQQLDNGTMDYIFARVNARMGAAI
jgi:hypothetical protein